MGSITFQVVGDASVGTRTKTFTISDENIDRFVDYCIAKAKSPTNPAPTVAQSLLRWAEDEMELLKAEVLDFEKHEAASNVTPIIAT